MTYTVGDLMSKKPISVKKSDNLETVLDVMNEFNVRHIPVVNSDGEIDGLISQSDMDKYLRPNSTLEMKKEQLQSHSTAEIMVSDVETISQDADLRDAGFTLLENKFGCLPVTDRGRLVGIISKSDFIKFTVDKLID